MNKGTRIAVLLVVGLAATFALVTWMGVVARRALARATAEGPTS